MVGKKLAAEWSVKNGDLKPTMVSVGSHKKVIWKGKCGHEWSATVKSRATNGTGCPYCSHNKILVGFNDLASQRPEIAAEWSEKNYPLKPDISTTLNIYTDVTKELRQSEFECYDTIDR